MPGHGGHTIEILASTARATQLPHLPILCTLGNTSFSTLSRVQKEKGLSSVVNSSLIWTEDPWPHLYPSRWSIKLSSWKQNIQWLDVVVWRQLLQRTRWPRNVLQNKINKNCTFMSSSSLPSGPSTLCPDTLRVWYSPASFVVYVTLSSLS